MKRFCIGSAVLFLLLGVSGCGAPKATLKGKITLDGKPLQDGSIQFEAVDRNAPTAGSPIDENGEYVVENVTVTPMIVRITSPKEEGKRKAYDTPNSPMIPIIKELVPAKYNVQTELKLDVKPGEHEKDWPLTSK